MEREASEEDVLAAALGLKRIPVEDPEGKGGLFWRPSQGFGAFLRECREAARLSLREAAEQLNMSFARLQKMETGGRYKAPELVFLSKLATLYKVSAADVFRAAGFEAAPSSTVQHDLDFELAFDALAFHPALNPYHMDRDWRYAYAPLVKQQWVEFAHQLEALHHREPGFLGRVMDSQVRFEGHPPADADPEAIKAWVLEKMLRSGALFVEGENPEFGQYLRRLRKEKGVTLQVAAQEMGLSYGILHRLETGEKGIDSIEQLRPIATYYNLVLEDTLARLGVGEAAMRALFKLETSNLDFVVLMQEPGLRPTGMTPQWMEKISAAQKRHFVDFAVKLVDWLEQGKPGVDALVEEHRRFLNVGSATVERTSSKAHEQGSGGADGDAGVGTRQKSKVG